MNAARALVASLLVCASSHAFAQQRADAVLLVNSASARYTDAQRRVQPFLDHYGVPYTILDIATTPVGADIASYALIIVGHPSLDTAGAYLDATAQQNIVNAVALGSGLVSFDHDLSVNRTGRYAFVQQLFGFGYGWNTSGSGLQFTADAAEHWVSARHAAGSTLTLNQVTAASLVPATGSKVLARFQDTSDPFLVTATYGTGRAVQWASSAWMAPQQNHFDFEGALHGLDDLVWRGLVWAARKPFVMQGLPPFVTMRVDDVKGPTWWAQTAVDAGLKPWMGVFLNPHPPLDEGGLSGSDSIAIQTLVWEGNATASVHSFAGGFFYYDDLNARELDDATLAANVAVANQWHESFNIPVSKVVIPHFYEIGTNAFATLATWGVRHVGTHVTPGQPYKDSWLQLGPWRKYDAGDPLANPAVSYADYLTVPGHPEYDGKFFDCVTEIRDDVGYEWEPRGNDVPGTIGNGTRQLKRALDAMTLATLFTHEYYLVGNNTYPAFTPDGLATTLSAIRSNISSYSPIYVTMDAACDYLRAKHDTRISSAVYHPDTGYLDATLAGTADVATKFMVFTESGGIPQQTFWDVSPFAGAQTVSQPAPAGASATLQSLTLAPASPTVSTGSSAQLTATARYSDGTTLGMTSQATWTSSDPTTATVSGGLVSGVAVGTATITATLGGVSTSTTVTVTLPPLTITSGTLPGAARLIPYSTTLAATGGLAPYGWSADTAQLPPGLSLAANGTLGGTPTTAGSYTFSVTVTDAETSTATATASVSLVVGSSSDLSLWPGTTVPSVEDKGADSSIELGVKFRTSVAGSIMGLRYYKSAANTGVHVGSLWTIGGALLASATFTSETESGWQEVRFATPVAIAADTLYVASYHTDVGHYARDMAYFADVGHSAGVLYAPSSTEGAGNGVYAYASSSAFPTDVSLHSNYWVDVVFTAGAAPALNGLSVTPTNPTLDVGSALRLKAMGAFTDGASHDISGQVLWSSSTGTVASVDPLGLVSALSAGTSTITAYYMDPAGAFTGTTTVTAAPRLGSVVVSPASARLLAGGTQQFAATGFDTQGNPMTGLTFTWSAGSGGTISGTGLFTAGVTAGTFTGNVVATSGTVSGAASTEVVGVASVALAPASVTGGASSTGTVTLSAAAPAGGAQVSLSSDTAGVTVPASVTIDAGQTSATFTVATSVVASPTTATITAGVGGSAGSGQLSVTNPVVTGVTFSPAAVYGGTSSTGTVTISQPAPTAGFVVTLSSDTVDATPAASVTVLQGQTSAAFSVTTSTVASATTATITASNGSTSATGTLTVNASPISTVTLSPTLVVGGTSTTGTVTLRTAAPAGGTVVTLSGNAASATVPTSVTVAAGATTATFSVGTSPVAASTAVTVTASFQGSGVSGTFTIAPPTVTAVTLSPSTVTGGASSLGTVYLTGAAPTGGATISVTSSDTASATLSAQITVPGGASSATFTISTVPVIATTSVTISAAASVGAPRTSTLTVARTAVSSVSLSPSLVVGSQTSTVTVTLTGAAPAGGLTATLSSSNTAAATVPASVSVPAGASTATFVATSLPVSANTDVTVSATLDSNTRSATLTVAAPSVTGVLLTPSSVIGGSATVARITLNGPAGPTGASIRISASAPASASSRLTIPAGASSASVSVSTSATATSTTAVITATGGGISRSATLSVAAPTLSALSVSPASIQGGLASVGTVTLSGPAPSGGTTVALASDSAAALVQSSSVTVAAGATSATFTVATAVVATTTTATLTATLGSTSVATPLEVRGLAVTALTLDQTSVQGGATVTGTVTITAPALAGGFRVRVSSNSAAATPQVPVTVPEGYSSTTFAITTSTVFTPTDATLTASGGGVAATATLTVTP